MVDITKCSGEGCHLRERCFRYMAKSDAYHPSYMAPPIKEGACDSFIEIDADIQSLLRRLWHDGEVN